MTRQALDASAARWLSVHQHPLVRAAALVHLSGRSTVDPRVTALQDQALDFPDLASVLATQHTDGSWGPSSSPASRILPTLLVARSLIDVGLTQRIAAVDRALDFLIGQALEPAPSINGRRDGVLACYAGMFADVFLRGERPDAAAAPLTWIATHQQICVGGDELLPGAEMWGRYLATRYGGCYASTSCLIGVFAAADALARGRHLGLALPGRADDLIDAAHRVIERRKVCFASDGSILPLAGRTKRDPAGTRWLAPAFPRNYLPDLIDLVGLARRLGADHRSTEPAVGLVRGWQMDDGRWALTGRRAVSDTYHPERVERSQPSAWITLRALAALR